MTLATFRAKQSQLKVKLARAKVNIGTCLKLARDLLLSKKVK